MLQFVNSIKENTNYLDKYKLLKMNFDKFRIEIIVELSEFANFVKLNKINQNWYKNSVSN